MNEDSRLATLYSPCVIRAAQMCHCDAIASLATQLGYRCTAEDVYERLVHMQDSGSYAVFIAELPIAKIAGWVGLYLFQSVEEDRRAEISGLVVDENMRSRGIGKILLDAAEQWARSIGCRTISVRSNIKRDRAHHFYLSNGYEHVKTRKEFRKDL